MPIPQTKEQCLFSVLTRLLAIWQFLPSAHQSPLTVPALESVLLGYPGPNLQGFIAALPRKALGQVASQSGGKPVD